MKKYFERNYDVLPATSKSTDDSEAQRATQSLSNQESREPVNVSSERASEDDPLEYTRSDDATMSKEIVSPYVQEESKDYHLNFKTMF